MSVEVPDATRVVVGREPVGEHGVTIASPSVSTNHVALEHRDGTLRIADLGSRNGTWVRAPRGAELVVDASVDGISVRLAPDLDARTPPSTPADAVWSNAATFAGAVSERVTEWLARCDLPARVATVARDAPRVDETGRMPLAIGIDLCVEPNGTVSSGWLDALATAERYVARQNLLFETEQSLREEGLVVASPAFRSTIARVIDIAGSGARVLLLVGASGTGKEGLARCFHRYTQRPGPFIPRNCAMFNKDLVRTELFGAERGAFTGSVQRIVGAVEAANTGTLFLDELGELPTEIQPMLLRFLDHGEYDRLGRAGTPLSADVRIVCATNRDMRLATQEGKFRTDLWFRLSANVVEIPPLRDRKEDIAAFLETQVDEEAHSLRERLSAEATALVNAYDWPGNFRELVSFAMRIARDAPHGVVSRDLAHRALSEGALRPLATGSPAAATATNAGLLAHVERAASSFAADRAGAMPRTWDEVKVFIESYLKPVMFAELSDAAGAGTFDAVDLRASASAVGSDRGTAAKQLRRYFDRFG